MTESLPDFTVAQKNSTKQNILTIQKGAGKKLIL